jgi:hypothetical protein
MEGVLDLDEEPDDPTRPKVCLDEMPYQLVGETRPPLSMQPGEPRRYDYEDRRHGTGTLFICFEPDAGYRHVEVTERRTAVDFAQMVKWLVDERYAEAQVVRVVLDQLNTPTGASRYEADEPEEAKRVLSRLEFHHPPKHGSWLNQAEIELSVLSGQCLDRRIPDTETLKREVAAWEAERNETGATVNWRFTTVDARTKLHRVYPLPL